MRTYEKTHPWIAIAVDLRDAPPGLWLMLGECASKCDHIAGVPLKPETAENLHRIYLAKGALATTAIEGNTLTEDEVRRHIDGTLRLPPSREYLATEIANIITGVAHILRRAVSSDSDRVTPDFIAELNRIVLSGLPLDEDVQPGEIRRHAVGVARYKAPPAEDCGYLLERMCAWLNGPDFAPQQGREKVYAILKAVIAHLYLAWIHPFGDGNGRTARLVEFSVLFVAGFPSPSVHLLSNFYNQTRAEYYRQLDRASRTGDVLEFVIYAVEGFRDGLQSQIDAIREQQWDVAWENFVHERFRDKDGKADVRRRRLVLDLAKRGDEFVPVNEAAGISPRVAAEYGGKTRKTLMRDINELVGMGLVERSDRGVRAHKRAILAFLPFQVPDRVSP